MLDSYVNFYVPAGPVGFIYRGSKDLELAEITTYEVGYRGSISKNTLIDTDLFLVKTKEFDNFFLPQAGSGLEMVGRTPYFILACQNLPLKAEQIGITSSLTFSVSQSLRIKPYVTLQKTHLSGNTFKDNYALLRPLPVDETGKHQATPDWYGGVNVEYLPSQNIRFALNSYFYSDQIFKTTLAEDRISENIWMNAHLTYDITKSTQILGSIKNIGVLGQDRQFGFADKIEPLVLVGINFSL